MMSFMMQIFLMCYFGQHVISESELLFMKFYESNWPGMIGTKGSRNLILILMEMLQQELIIVIGKILTLSLKTFTSVRFV